MKRRVVITGLGVVSPVGIGKEEFWQNLRKGKSGATPLDHVTCTDLLGQHEFGTKVVCEVKKFRPGEHDVPPAYQSMDRFIQFALATAHQAVQDANLDIESLDTERIGVALATAIFGSQTMDREFIKGTNYGKEPLRSQDVSPHLYSALMGNSAAISIASRYGLQGECLTLSTGCIAGLDAISYAYDSIAYGDHDVMITGASEAPITPIPVAAFDIINCLSCHPYPATASRPFSLGRDGFVLAEGCGIVVLEELEHALHRQASIYAEIVGWDVVEHAEHMTNMSFEGADLARAINNALQDANLRPHDIDFINAHGTSTQQNDSCETEALKAALGEYAYSIPVNSTKSMQGHALAAASAMEIVACTMSLQEQYIHPTVNLDDPDPECDLDYVPRQGRPHPMRWLLTIASGFSGLHAVMVMGTYSAESVQ